MICRPLTVVARFQVCARTRSTASSSANSADESWSLAIPNPLKSLTSKSSENIGPRNTNGTAPEGLAPPNTDSSRLWFGQDQVVGDAVFSSQTRMLRGLRSQYVVARDAVMGLAWTDTEVLVCSGTHIVVALNQPLYADLPVSNWWGDP